MNKRFETLKAHQQGGVVFVDIAAPPMNLLGARLVRDVVSLIQEAEADPSVQVLVFRSADPRYFISHVDVTEIAAFRQEAARLTGENSLGLLFRHLSTSRLITIAQITGRVRGAGSEFILACDLRYAACETAIFGQPEVGFGLIPGAGAIQHLARLTGRGRALEIMLSGDDYSAEIAERYGWINRAMPSAELDGFVRKLAERISRFPEPSRSTIKRRVDALTMSEIEEFRIDSDLFLACARDPSTQATIKAAFDTQGFQTADGEIDLGARLGRDGWPRST